jgi:tetratricopeptide (TPR) repeat protein
MASVAVEGPRICLSMIVKNESKIIRRMLDTVSPIIDAYCICDTGSTDDTIQVIKDYFGAKGVIGEVFSHPFKNFGYNRTVALQRAAIWAEYALLLDADMRLVVGPAFNKVLLDADAYSCLQGGRSLEYYNTRIVRTRIGITCVGPTHEFYDIPKSSRIIALPRDALRIDDVGDGGSKQDKFERDIRLLEEGLKEEPGNSRYHFYLANSYRDVGKKAEAVSWYKKHIGLGGWDEEIWNSVLEMGKCQLSLGESANGLATLMEAYSLRPHRAESLYEIIKYYREKSKHNAAQLFLDAAKSIPYPSGDILFIRKDVYSHLLDYEQSILSFYTKRPVDHRRYLELMAVPSLHANVMANYRFYARSLNKMEGVLLQRVCLSDSTTKTIEQYSIPLTSSTPSITSHNDGYLLNIRYVNYSIARATGQYTIDHPEGKIVSLNKAIVLGSQLEPVHEVWLDRVHRTDHKYVGIEDVRIFAWRGSTRFLGTTVDDAGNLRVGGGEYMPATNIIVPTVYPSPAKDVPCEKNWLLFEHAGQPKILYSWKPLIVGSTETGTFVPERAMEDVPAHFRHLRGSSNGACVDDEIWFLTHMVNHSAPRHYYHCFVILDAVSLAVRRWSTLFTFEGEKIEYAAGLVVEPDRVMITYSTWDSESILAVYDRRKLCAAVF